MSHTSQMMREQDTQVNPPRLRLSFKTSSPLTLTDTFQQPQFQVSGTYDQDSFVGGRWDAANNKIVIPPMINTDIQYFIEFFYKFRVGALESLVSLLSPINLVLRFKVPAPTPIYFPFPDGDQEIDFNYMMFSPLKSMYNMQIYCNSTLRQYGLQLEVKTRQSLLALGRPIMIDGALSMYQR